MVGVPYFLMAIGCCAAIAAGQSDPAPPVAVAWRVVDAAGQPLSGAEAFLPGADQMYAGKAIARSDGTGLCQIPRSELGNERYVLVRKPGRVSLRVPVVRGAAEPGEVVLGPGRTLAGRVRNADGEPLAGARVVVTDILATREFLEARDQARGSPRAHECAITNAAGIFVLRGALDRAMTLRVSASGFVDRVLEPVAVDTPLDVTLAVARQAAPAPASVAAVRAPLPPADDPEVLRLRVRLRDAAGQAIERFRVKLVWGDADNAQTDTSLWWSFRSPVQAEAGTAILESKSDRSGRVPFLLVEADGFVRQVVRELPPAEPDLETEVEVQVEPESRLAGVAKYSDGKPIAGMRLWALPKTDKVVERHRSDMMFDRDPGAQRGAVTSDAKGQFELVGLAAGESCVLAYDPEVGLVPLQELKLGAGEHRKDFEFRVATHRVRVRPVGLPRDSRWKVRLKRHAPGAHSSSWAQDYSGAVRAGPDGAFEFPRVLEGKWDVQLVCTMPPRSGRPRKVPVAVLEVAAAIDQQVDVSKAAMPIVEGRVKLGKSTIPYDRLVVVSEQAEYAGNHFFAYLNLKGTYGLVDADGRFSLPSPIGPRHLLLLDLLTGVVLGRTTEAVTVTGDSVLAVELSCYAHAVDLRVSGRTDSVYVDLYVSPEMFPWGVGEISKRWAEHEYTLRMGALFPDGAETLRLYLPEGETELRVRARTAHGEVLGTQRVAPRDRLTEVTVDVGAQGSGKK